MKFRIQLSSDIFSISCLTIFLIIWHWIIISDSLSLLSDLTAVFAVVLKFYCFNNDLFLLCRNLLLKSFNVFLRYLYQQFFSSWSDFLQFEHISFEYLDWLFLSLLLSDLLTCLSDCLSLLFFHFFTNEAENFRSVIEWVFIRFQIFSALNSSNFMLLIFFLRK